MFGSVCSDHLQNKNYVDLTNSYRAKYDVTKQTTMATMNMVIWISVFDELEQRAVSKLVATATAMTAAKAVAKDVLYFSLWWRGNLAIAVAVATTSDMA